MLTPFLLLTQGVHSQNVSATWGANSNSAWYTGGNWSGSSYAGVQGGAALNNDIATFTNAFAALTVGINMGTANLNLGAIVTDNTRTTATNLGNSSVTAGVLRLYGATVNGVANVILDHNGTRAFTIQQMQSGVLELMLGNAADNIINIGAAGSVNISAILSGNGPLTKTGIGTGVLTLSNTSNNYTGKTNINSGFINIGDEAALGLDPLSFVADQIMLNGGGLQTTTGDVTFSNHRGIALGLAGGAFDVGSGFTLSLRNPVAGTGDLIKYGAGTLQLNNSAGNTIPASNNIIVSDGTLQISTDQIINDISLKSGNLIIDNGVTLTVNGIFDYFKTGTAITLNGSGIIKYGPAGTLKYSGSPAATVSTTEWPVSDGPFNVIIDNLAGVLLPATRSVSGSLSLTSGIFTIGAAALLDLNGASVSSSAGYLAGTNTSDLTVQGATGGVVTIPTNSNINLRTITLGGLRTVTMDGIHHINLSGSLTIAAGATFDNGGESQLLQNGGGAVHITGTFITRDFEGFTGTGTSIPGIVPILDPGCIIEYGRAGNQSISIRSDYQDLRISGGGIKTHASANGITPIAGTVTIPDATVLDVSNNTFGSATTGLNMTNGRFRVSGTGPKPDIDGLFSLSGNSVIEFSNSGTVNNETVKGKNGLGMDILYNRVEITGNKVANSNSNINLNTNGVFVVKPGGSFEINDNSIVAPAATSGQSVIVENNGTFLCGNNQGFNGFSASFTDNSSVHSNITNIMLHEASTVNYTRPGNQPITIANFIEYGHLILSGSGTKTAPAGVLIVRGDLINAGAAAFEANAGTVRLNGNTQSFAGFTYNNLLLDSIGIKTLSGNADIIDSIRIGNPGSNLLTGIELGNYDLTLRSTATQTAKVATMPPLATISYSGTGRFVVERFHKSLRAWRMITLPVTSKGTPTSSIFDTWQNAGIYEAGKGMFVTGAGAAKPTPGPDGLDWSDQNNYSLKRFTDNKYSNIERTKDSLVSGNLSDTASNIGYFAFVRGDRSRLPDNTILPNSNFTTLSGKGKLQTGRQTFHVNTDSINSFTLIGNPYACPIDFSLVTKNNVYPNRFVVYDPTINGVGVFVIMEDGGTGIFTPVNVPSTQNNYIQSGQAFLVQPNNIMAPADLVFNETNKSVNNNNSNIFRPAGNHTHSFRTLLNKRNNNDSTFLADGVEVQCAVTFTDEIDISDALKFANVSENLGLMHHGRVLAVEKRPVFTETDTIFYKLTKTTRRNYQLEFQADLLTAEAGLVGYLLDNFTKMSSLVDIPGTTKVNFSVGEDPASADPGRFKIVFKRRPVPLVSNHLIINVWQQENYVALEWNVENEVDIISYDVEKSLDGMNFKKVNTSRAAGSGDKAAVYHWLDTAPLEGINYYRVKSIDKDARKLYTRIVKIKSHKFDPGFEIFPNPVTGNKFDIKFKNMQKGQYSVRILNSSGQTVLQKMINHFSAATTEVVSTDYKLAPGTYQLEIVGPETKITTIKLFFR